MKKQYRKSDLNIIDEKNMRLITNKHNALLDCELGINTRENVELTYKICGETLKTSKLKRHEKIQVISKLTKIVLSDLQMLEFDISPDNIYIEDDGNVLICERRIVNVNANIREEQLLKQLKALTGYLLESINYEELLEVDSVQLQTSKKLAGITETRTLVEFNQFITEILKAEMNKLHSEQLVVSQKSYKQLKSNKLAYRVGLAGTLLFILFLLLYVIPFKNKEVRLYEAYQDMDSATLLEIVKDVNINRLSNNEKVIAAKAVINDQVELNDKQKNNIIQSLDSKTNEKIFDYWLYIGKGEYDQANNQAIALSDADMQMYALLLLINEAQNNDDLEAAERKELVDGYETQIDDLNQKKAEVNGEQNE